MARYVMHPSVRDMELPATIYNIYAFYRNKY
jgi:hypothetical protein